MVEDIMYNKEFKDELMGFEYFPYTITQSMKEQIDYNREKLENSYLADKLFYQRFTHIKKIFTQASIGAITYKGFEYLNKKELLSGIHIGQNVLATSAALAAFLYIYINFEKSRTYLSSKYTDKSLNIERQEKLKSKAQEVIGKLDDGWRHDGCISEDEPEPWCLRELKQDYKFKRDSKLSYQTMSVFYNIYKLINNKSDKKEELI